MLPGQWLKAQGARKCGTVRNSVPSTGRHSINIYYLLTLPVSESDKCVITKHDLSCDHCSWALLGGLAGQEDPLRKRHLSRCMQDGAGMSCRLRPKLGRMAAYLASLEGRTTCSGSRRPR